MKKTYDRVHFNNGGSISIQASHTHYCEPRDNEGPYSEVEVAYPTKGTKYPKSLLDYSDTPDEPVFAYVPSDIVEQIIEMNGGVKRGEVPPLTTGE
jgi:hypothetical protein